jgi:hypothetical protein
MRRIYTSVAHFRAPFDTTNISFAGLGMNHSDYDANKWPVGRSYWAVDFYRSPYQQGFYQSGALRGSDAMAPSDVPGKSGLPHAVKLYAETGQQPSPFRRDLGTVSNQIPRWGYFALALGSAWFAYRAWNRD